MNRHISGYNDDYYIFKVCFNNDEHIRFMQTGLNHIFKLGDEIRLYTYDGYIIMPESAEIIFDEFNEDDVLSIKKVYQPPVSSFGQMLNAHNPIWERKEVRKMTVAEICKELGYEVEIVK